MVRGTNNGAVEARFGIIGNGSVRRFKVINGGRKGEAIWRMESESLKHPRSTSRMIHPDYPRTERELFRHYYNPLDIDFSKKMAK